MSRKEKNKNHSFKIMNKLPKFIYENFEVKDMNINTNQNWDDEGYLYMTMTVELELKNQRFFEITLNSSDYYDHKPGISIKCYWKRWKWEQAGEEIEGYWLNDKYISGPGWDREYTRVFWDEKNDKPCANWSEDMFSLISVIKHYANLGDK